MITADEARVIAEAARSAVVPDEVYAKIRKSAEEGCNYKLLDSHKLTQPQAYRLRSQGYTVEAIWVEGGWCWGISW